MRDTDKGSGLEIVTRDNLRTADVADFTAGLKLWRDRRAPGIAIRDLSGFQYNAAVTFAAAIAGWVVHSGRATPPAETPIPIVSVETIPPAAKDEVSPEPGLPPIRQYEIPRLTAAIPAEAEIAAALAVIDAFPAGVTQWYGDRLAIAYAATFEIPAN